MSFPAEIKPLMDKLMASPKFKKRWTEHIIHEKWQEWVGKRIAQHIRPGNLRDEWLTVIIDDEKWINPFQAFEEKIIEKMVRDLGSPAIQGFRILTEKKTPSQKGGKGREKCHIPKQKNPKKPSSKPDPSLGKDFEEALNHIHDTGLRDALKHMVTKALSFDHR
jgi:hypothetical protein